MQQLKRIEKSFKTLGELIDARPDISQTSKTQLARVPTSDSSLFERIMNSHVTTIDTDDIRIIYNMQHFWNLEKGAKGKEVEKYITSAEHVKEFIFVSNKPVKFYTPKNALWSYVTDDLHKAITFFTLDDLQFNVTKHALVPKHERITDEEEKAEIKKVLNIKSFHQIPVIYVFDPVVKAIGGQVDDLIKVTRYTGEHSGEHIVYRYCIWQDE